MKTTLFQVLRLVVIIALMWILFFGHAHPQGWPNQPTLQMSANRALRGLRNHLEKDFDWGKYMMNANGLLPLEGFLSDTFSVPLYLCNIFDPAAAPNCEELPEFLTRVAVRMLVDFLLSPCSLDLRLGGVHTKFRVKNQYCTVSLKSPEVHIKGAVLYPLEATLALIIF